jgi:hypothetical protein
MLWAATGNLHDFLTANLAAAPLLRIADSVEFSAEALAARRRVGGP